MFHESMRTVLEPLIDAGNQGVDMVGSDGVWRKVFPILTCYIANYPEQCLVTCSKYGTCVKCQAPAKDLQNPIPAEAQSQTWTKKILDEGRDQANGNAHAFHTYCMSFDVARTVYKPFWDGFSLCDINRSITPDVQYFTVPHRFRPESGNSAGMAPESAGMTGFHRNGTGMT